MNNADKPINPTSTINDPYLRKELQTTTTTTTHIGLTKREYFAGIALQGILSNRWSMEFGNYNEEAKAEMAIKQADELLKQLETK